MRKAAIEVGETAMDQSGTADVAARERDEYVAGAVPGHWSTAAYLLTNSLECGLLLLLTGGLLLEFIPFDLTTLLVAAALALSLLAATVGLMQWGLRARMALWQFVRHPVWSDWMTRGLAILLLLAAVVIGWSGVEIAAERGGLAVNAAENWRTPLQWSALLLALAGAAFPAYLLAQQPDRALWRNPLLPLHFVLHALLAGSGLFLLLSTLITLANGLETLARTTFWLLLFANLFAILGGEFGMTRASAEARDAARRITHGYYRDMFWWGCIGLGHVVPMGLLLLDHPLVTAQAGFYVWIGIFCFTYAYIMAPQPEANIS